MNYGSQLFPAVFGNHVLELLGGFNIDESLTIGLSRGNQEHHQTTEKSYGDTCRKCCQ
jgi:hypothetical protein